MIVEKKIARGEAWTELLLKGVREMADLVGSTYGPEGRNVIIYRKYKSPMITNDGVTVARETYLNNELEDLAAQVLVEISMKTNEQAGDGTTGSVVQAAALIESTFEKIKNTSPINPGPTAMQLFHQINAARPAVVEMIKKMSKKVAKDDLQKIVRTSLENEEFASKIAEMMQQVGPDGYISVEDNWETQNGIDVELTLGMKCYGTYASPYMINAPRKEAIWKNTAVLLTNEHIESLDFFTKDFATAFRKTGKRNLVVIAEKFEQPVIKAVVAALQAAAEGQDATKILLVKAPSLTTEEFQDVAAYTKAIFFDKKLGQSIRDATVQSLGHLEKVVVNQDEVFLTGGTGDVSERVERLKGEMEAEKDTMFKNKLKIRLAKLTAGIGVIRVGASTEQERTYLKHKIEDAKHAARAAMQEGWVPGAGKALATIAGKLGKDHILYDMLMAPSKKIEENAGGPIEVPDWVMDPAKVVRLSFENACSAAGVLISSGSGVAEKRKNLLDLLSKQILEEEEDFREYAERREP